jgi:hypothetical protein
LSKDWQIALADFPGQISFNYPANKLTHFYKNNPFIFPQIIHKTPVLQARLVFTDGSANGVAAVVTDGQVHTRNFPPMSAQRVELHAILPAFEILSKDAFNLFTDSQYLYQVLCTTETALISHTADKELFHLFLQLRAFTHHCSAPCFVGHLCAYTNLPDPLTQENAVADAATQQVICFTIGPGFSCPSSPKC